MPDTMPRSMRPCACAAFCLVAAAAVLAIVSDAKYVSAEDAAAAIDAAEAEQFFEQKVRPLLANRCFECHGPDTQESSLRLDSRDAILAGGDSGQSVFDAEAPENSRLLKAIRRQGDIKMPPDDPLPQGEVDVLVAWVTMGLPWAQSAGPIVQPMSMEERIADQRAHLWSLQEIRRPELPDVADANWPSMPLDRFVLAKLAAAGLSPSPEAERHTLIRRASFDLLGLPPTPDEVDAYLADERPDAYERLVDRLLASPRYGERWGRHWLDVARYADTRGYAFARERRFPYAYTYRDWVIGALNADLPYDRFIVEQLAADRLPPSDDPAHLAALGFLTVGRKFNNPHDDIDDQIDAVGRGLLGLTLACARCHDHKYDGIPTEDYYSLYGVFASSTEPDVQPLISSPAENEAYRMFEEELAKRRKVLDDFQTEKLADVLETARTRAADYLARVLTAESEAQLEEVAFLSLSPDEIRPRLVERWRDYLQDKATPDHAVLGLWRELAAVKDEEFSRQAPAIIERFAALAEGTEPGQINPRLKSAFAADPPLARIDVARVYGKLFADAYTESKSAPQQEGGRRGRGRNRREPDLQQLLDVLMGQGAPTDISLEELRRYLSRADRNRQGELQKEIQSYQVSAPAAPPRAMAVVDRGQPVEPRVFIRGNQRRPGKEVPRQFPVLLAGVNRTPFADGSGRMELARAIVAPNNPLTRRVMANRVWMYHFGRPLVDSASDFGARSDSPVQGELLDYLAWRLGEGEWSLKDLHRQVVLSRTYRQSSVDRPECRAADPENRLLWRANRQRLEFEPMRDALLAVSGQLDLTMNGRAVDLFAGSYSKRRAVYGMIDRQDLPNLLRVFDFASPDSSSAGRPNTIVPQQALFLMNSPLVIEQARALAARPEVNGESDSESRIAALYRLLFSRSPSPEETQIGLEYLSSCGSQPDSGSKLSPWEQYAHLLLLSNEFVYVD